MRTRTAIATGLDIARTIAPRLVLSLLITLLLAISARISFMTPLSPVPVTLQVAAVLLAGLMLGPRWGAWSVVQYIGLGLLGAPVFAMGTGGPGVVSHPSFGYLLAFVAAAYVTGAISSRSSRNLAGGIISGIAGVGVIYLGGAAWLAGFLALGGMSAGKSLIAAVTQGMAPFVVVDILKVVMVAGIWSIRGRLGRN
jgi:biotin transport system substrate-specific component